MLHQRPLSRNNIGFFGAKFHKACRAVASARPRDVCRLTNAPPSACRRPGHSAALENARGMKANWRREMMAALSTRAGSAGELNSNCPCGAISLRHFAGIDNYCRRYSFHQAWQGSLVALIKLTSAVFRRRSGANRANNARRRRIGIALAYKPPAWPLARPTSCELKLAVM